MPSFNDPDGRCGTATGTGRLVQLPGTDQVSLTAAVAGTGRAGVILVHEYPADLCGFWPFAAYLTQHGYQVIDLDLRCFGTSTCPPDAGARAHLAADVGTAAAWLRHQGATQVSVVGASMGGTVALQAAAETRPALTAAVCLSCHAQFVPLVGGSPVPLDISHTVRALRMPVLYVVGAHDPHLQPGEIPALYRDTTSPGKQLHVLDGAAATRHGWDLLTQADNEAWSDTAATVVTFLHRTDRTNRA